MKKWLLPLAASSLMFSLPAFAVDTYVWSPDHEKRFKAKDLNGDGTITKEEFLHTYNGQFQRIDSDNNKQISMSEMRQYLQHKRPKHVTEKQWSMKTDRHFGRKDRNKDNVISESEFLTKHQRSFEGYDRDGNNEISKDEMRIYWENEKAALESYKEKKGKDDD